MKRARSKRSSIEDLSKRLDVQLRRAGPLGIHGHVVGVRGQGTFCRRKREGARGRTDGSWR